MHARPSPPAIRRTTTMTLQDPTTEFEGRRVVVTGGTKGAGLATVKRFVAGGATVVTVARGEAVSPSRAHVVAADLSAPDGAARLADAVLARMGGVDVLLH